MIPTTNKSERKCFVFLATIEPWINNKLTVVKPFTFLNGNHVFFTFLNRRFLIKITWILKSVKNASNF